MTMSTRFLLDRAILAAIVVVLAASVVIHLRDSVYFNEVYAVEDGLVENGTARFLLISSLIMLGSAVSLWRKEQRMAAALTAFYGLIFFVGAGEEISWGQRIFDWQPSEFFLKHNAQKETNLHNLVVGNVPLTKTVFGKGLTVFVLVYLVTLPLLYPRLAILRRMVDRLAIPVPGLRHAVLALAASLVVVAIQEPRRWEVYEWVFSMLMASVFLLPQNRDRIR